MSPPASAQDATAGTPFVPGRSSRAHIRARLALLCVVAILLLALFVARRESRQREVDRDLFSAVYGENPEEVARLLRLGANPNSRLDAKRFTWLSRAVLRLQGNPLWNNPRIDQTGCLLIYVDQKRNIARTRIGRFVKPRRSASTEHPLNIGTRLENLRASEVRLGRIRDLLVEYGARR